MTNLRKVAAAHKVDPARRGHHGTRDQGFEMEAGPYVTWSRTAREEGRPTFSAGPSSARRRRKITINDTARWRRGRSPRSNAGSDERPGSYHRTYDHRTEKSIFPTSFAGKWPGVSNCRWLRQVRPAAAPLTPDAVLYDQQKDESPLSVDVNPGYSGAFAALPACQDALVLLGLVPLP
ncbi:hypothetical protein GCM10027161_69530 [Microbispora hainanensis]